MDNFEKISHSLGAKTHSADGTAKYTFAQDYNGSVRTTNPPDSTHSGTWYDSVPVKFKAGDTFDGELATIPIPMGISSSTMQVVNGKVQFGNSFVPIQIPFAVFKEGASSTPFPAQNDNPPSGISMYRIIKPINAGGGYLQDANGKSVSMQSLAPKVGDVISGTITNQLIGNVTVTGISYPIHAGGQGASGNSTIMIPSDSIQEVKTGNPSDKMPMFNGLSDRGKGLIKGGVIGGGAGLIYALIQHKNKLQYGVFGALALAAVGFYVSGVWSSPMTIFKPKEKTDQPQTGK